MKPCPIRATFSFATMISLRTCEGHSLTLAARESRAAANPSATLYKTILNSLQGAGEENARREFLGPCFSRPQW
jgi:hypothetical protein